MARPRKEIDSTVEHTDDAMVMMTEVISEMAKEIEILKDAVSKLKECCCKPTAAKTSINKIEKHSGDVETPIEEYSIKSLTYDDRIQSMVNTIRILPPNMTVDGKHTIENIQALVGFPVDEEMIDEAYKRIG